jgi:anti-anti-sigma factor
MDTTIRLIEIERADDTLVLTLLHDLRELEYQEIETEQEEVLEVLESDPSLVNLVVDCGTTDYFGSTAVGLLARLRQQVRRRGGRMVLVHPSPHEQDILAVTGLSGVWPVYASRDEALTAVKR